ncbi:hypothetical protein GLOIN_2v1667018 [Rhizophagus clarus]|uniref:Uncharacterized protein n=1 Tax=Rhizophagus clarus TaxID=94130 RepID=A0A8H3LW57_9GLOM|nr:hypothetical protein GLOIN_2v1667018 [Rhizophagus clarus]
MNSYQEVIFFPFKQQMQRFHSSTFESIRFRNDCIIKRKTNYKQNLLNFIIWNFVFFSFFPFVSASIAPYVDKSYDSHEDLYDALLNTFFPIFFVILLNVSGKPGSIKNVLLPLLDDVLYNIVTWVIPLVVSFSYDDLMSIKIFSTVNMYLHVFCAIYAIIKWERVTKDNSNNLNNHYQDLIFFFLIFFPVIVIPVFWIIIIITEHVFDLISIIFLTLFGLCLVSFIVVALYMVDVMDMAYLPRILLIIIFFYVPNILQTLLITLNWPINFYFVKACIFILVLSLTRNVSYYDKVPKDFLATSTTLVQCTIRFTLKDRDMNKTYKMTDDIDEMNTKIDEMRTKIDTQEQTQKAMQMTIDEIQKTISMKISMDEIKDQLNEIV